MATVTSGVTLAFGPLVSARVDVESAITSPSSHTTLCVGSADKPHPPDKPKQSSTCPTCGNADKATFTKGRPKGKDAYVLLTDQELAAIDAEVEAFKGERVELFPHPSEQVKAKTLPGGKVYYLTSDASTAEAYALIAAALKTHPELTLCCRLALRTAVTMFALRTFGDVLVLEQLAWPADIKAMPMVPTSFAEGALPLAEQLLASLTRPFDPAAYRDVKADKLAEIVAAKDPQAATAQAAVVELPTGGDLMATLRAAVAANTPKPKRTRKPKPKPTPAEPVEAAPAPVRRRRKAS